MQSPQNRGGKRRQPYPSLRGAGGSVSFRTPRRHVSTHQPSFDPPDRAAPDPQSAQPTGERLLVLGHSERVQRSSVSRIPQRRIVPEAELPNKILIGSSNLCRRFVSRITSRHKRIECNVALYRKLEPAVTAGEVTTCSRVNVNPVGLHRHR